MKRVSARDWFLLNLKIGALSFGGSGRILMYQDGVVRDAQWMSEEEFAEVLTVSQVLPGPNLVNMSYYLGLALSGPWSAFWGVLALVIPGALMVVLLVSFLNLDNPDVRLVFQGFSMGSAALFGIFLWRYWLGVLRMDGPRVHPWRLLGRLAIAGGAIAATFQGCPLLWVLGVGGLLGFLLELGLS
ncbi:MAG: chromate transporter [Bdellovibrionales bacterium]|nr:chromate transporter [Bdellovibrionales bacterium]